MGQIRSSDDDDDDGDADADADDADDDVVDDERRERVWQSRRR